MNWRANSRLRLWLAAGLAVLLVAAFVGHQVSPGTSHQAATVRILTATVGVALPGVAPSATLRVTVVPRHSPLTVATLERSPTADPRPPRPLPSSQPAAGATPTAARPSAHRPRSLPGTASDPPKPGLASGVLGRAWRNLPGLATPRGVTGTPAVVTPLPPGVPVRLRIPALGIDTHTESVSLSGADMAVPATAWDVAWFKLGPRPGLAGNAVIDGHLDTATGPAIFLRLGTLAPGDMLYVRDSYGVERTFKVTELASYADSKAPLTLIFGPSSVPHLNLITCAGTWQADQKNYSQRLVVYSTLVA